MLCKLPKLYINNERKNFERSTVSTYGQLKKTMKDFEEASHPLGQDLNPLPRKKHYLQHLVRCM